MKIVVKTKTKNGPIILVSSALSLVSTDSSGWDPLEFVLSQLNSGDSDSPTSRKWWIKINYTFSGTAGGSAPVVNKLPSQAVILTLPWCHGNEALCFVVAFLNILSQYIKKCLHSGTHGLHQPPQPPPQPHPATLTPSIKHAAHLLHSQESFWTL